MERIMMESSNLDHHQQDLLHESSSCPPLPFHALGGRGGGSHREWNHHQTIISNNGHFIPRTTELLSSSRDFKLGYETPLPSLNLSTDQDLGFQWATNAPSYMNHSSNQVTQMPQIKEELPAFSSTEDYHMAQINSSVQPLAAEPHFEISSLASCSAPASCVRGNFSLVHPTANISSMNQLLTPFPVSLALELQALDVLASTRYGRRFCQPSMNSMALFREDTPSNVLGPLQQPIQELSNNNFHKVTTLVPGVAADPESANNILDNTATSQAVAKKPRLDSRSSFSPFKVRKEKLGDRIAALQQLVAPFGKTDTASVLMEAIGYIKFLQDQVETLSVPYMRSSSNKKLRTTTQGATGEEREEQKPDLRSRGLCLVPLSCTSYVTSDSSGLWSPPSFRGGT